MMRNFKITIEYNGKNFQGWQIQNPNQRTICGEITKALEKIFETKITLIGSGRTDSGVHAVGQVAHFKANTPMDLREIHLAINGNLPDDVAILKIEEVPLKFHAQYHPKSKTYRYTIYNHENRRVLLKDQSMFYPFKINMKLMKEEAKFLLGRKNFRAFQASDPLRTRSQKTKDTIRTVKRIDIKKQGDFITIDIEANGFLYKMVRNIVGTLLYVGSGRLPPKSIPKILRQKDRTLAGETAKAHGLTLLRVDY